jgi:hypothetical protein
MLSWMDRYPACKSRLNGLKVYVRSGFYESFQGAPLELNFEHFWCFHIIPLVNQYTAYESQLNDSKFLLGQFFMEKSTVATLKWD